MTNLLGAYIRKNLQRPQNSRQYRRQLLNRAVPVERFRRDTRLYRRVGGGVRADYLQSPEVTHDPVVK